MAENTSYAIPKDNITVTPNDGYMFIQELPRTCGNCRHWAKIDEYEKKGYCINPDMPAFVDGGISTPVKAEFGCLPLWEERQGEGE